MSRADLTSPLVSPSSSVGRKQEANVFKMCFRKCTSGTPTNLKGETIHHTIYECIDHCGFKYQNAVDLARAELSAPSTP